MEFQVQQELLAAAVDEVMDEAMAEEEQILDALSVLLSAGILDRDPTYVTVTEAGREIMGALDYLNSVGILQTTVEEVEECTSS